jgi:peptidoglycan/LPS O-acetylase OafA/YrhL
MDVWARRENNFDLMRLALAVLVIYSHAFALGLGSEATEPFARWTGGQVTGGAIAVDSFFVMSGFLIAASAERSRGVWGFLKKRVARIYPAFAVAALLTVLVVLPLSGGRLVWDGWLGRVGNFVGQTLWLREFSYAGAFAGNPFPGVINGSTWSIPYEFWCYVGVALLMVTGLLRRRGVVLGLFVASWLLSLGFRVEGWVLGGKELGAMFGPPQIWARMWPLYLSGVVFWLYRERIALRGWMAAVSAAALVGASLVSWGWTALFPLAGAYLLLWFAFTPGVRLHGFGRFGDFSYGTYLYAFPVEQLVVKVVGHGMAPLALFAAATPVTLLLAVGSWYGVERRFLGAGRKKESLVEAVAG